MYTQKNYLLSDLQLALTKKIQEAKATAGGEIELRIGSDGRAYLSVKIIRDDWFTETVALDL